MFLRASKCGYIGDVDDFQEVSGLGFAEDNVCVLLLAMLVLLVP
jgi:hypothetical protein